MSSHHVLFNFMSDLGYSVSLDIDVFKHHMEESFYKHTNLPCCLTMRKEIRW